MIEILGYAAFFLTLALSYAVIALGLNVQWGQTGLFNVGVAGFVGIGAYASAILTTPDAADRIGGFALPVPVGWAAAFAAAALASLVLGWLTIRLRSDYLAIATFGFAVTVQLAALNLEPLTGGPFGLGFIPRPFAGYAADPLVFGLCNLALVALVLAFVWWVLERLVRSPWGRVLKAIREDEEAARALGKPVTRFRLQAFAIGGGIMGLGGALQAHFIGFIAPENYLPTLTFQVWTMLVVGGAGNNLGAVVGSVVVWGLWSGSSFLIGAAVDPGNQARAAALQIVLIGVALCLILVLRPKGLLAEVLSHHRRDPSGAAAPERPATR
ncbi:branched-chain amino acid ABC transporter permease [Aureimonas sp. AU4]|jgi:branched-chain amino acid transport system permease protein|uniref:branched-chain amino acid ABC transporter permease n=1 Tax=Aureimonas sp. AU4 TaxID=1638163 RepID=UPI0007857947|nr:branched-chain amino acid ABC transporter permease [Aureimonas sp. AU4]